MNEMQLVTLVHAVANELSRAEGESWVLVGDQAKRGFGVDMRSAAGEIVSFQTADRGGYISPRLYIEGIDPLTACTVSKPITVLIARGPAVIAREVVSRLLSGYREVLAARRAKEARDKAEWDARAAAVNAAEALFGSPSEFGEFDPNRPGRDVYRTEARLALRGTHAHGLLTYPDSEFARVKASGDGTLMNLELSHVPAAVVMRMLAVLAEHNATWPEEVGE